MIKITHPLQGATLDIERHPDQPSFLITAWSADRAHVACITIHWNERGRKYLGDGDDRHAAFPDALNAAINAAFAKLYSHVIENHDYQTTTGA